MTRRREASFIVRVWFEGDPPTEFRARLVEVGRGPERTVATTAKPDEVIDAVSRWLDDQHEDTP